MFELIFWLLAGHAIFDFGLQHEYIAKAKNKLHGPEWFWVLGAHSAMHAAAVAYVTGYVWIGMLEFVAHFVVDYAKGQGWFGKHPRSYHIDQSLHIACKVVWAIITLSISQ